MARSMARRVALIPLAGASDDSATTFRNPGNSSVRGAPVRWSPICIFGAPCESSRACFNDLPFMNSPTGREQLIDECG